MSSLSTTKRALLDRLRSRHHGDDLALRVPRRAVGEEFPLSLSQERLLGKEAPLNHYYLMGLEGSVDIDALRSAGNELVRRHENLRTVFPLVHGKRCPQVLEPFDIELPVIDVTAHPDRRQEYAEALARAEASREYDLSTGPLIRCGLYKVDEKNFVLLMAIHLLVFDVWSMGNVVKELGLLYDSARRGVPSPLPALPIQYGDYARWQQHWLQTQEPQRQLRFWQRELAGSRPTTLRPRKAPMAQSFEGEVASIVLPGELVTRVYSFAREHNVTPYMVMLAGFAVFISKESDTRDVLIGTPVANRTLPELEPLIGYFPNVLPMRIHVDQPAGFTKLVDTVRTTTLNAFAHQSFPFHRYRPALELDVPVDAPLVRILFSLQNTPMPALEFSGLKVSPVRLDYGIVSPFDLTFLLMQSSTLIDAGDAIGGQVHWNTQLYSADDVHGIWGRYLSTLDALLNEPR